MVLGWWDDARALIGGLSRGMRLCCRGFGAWSSETRYGFAEAVGYSVGGCRVYAG